MNSRYLLIFSLILILGQALHAQQVSLETLLREVTSHDQAARFPAWEYRSLQASSYNRESVSPDKPGWFADSDGIGYIREEMNDGKKEFVVMEHTGPGCLTRIWTPFFYYDFNNHKGPNIRIYLDGSAKPVIDECFIDLVTGKGSIKPPFTGYTARAGDCFLPIPFAKSCKITLTDRSFYNIINYRAYPPETKVKSFSIKQYQKRADQVDAAAKILMVGPAQDGIQPAWTRITLESSGIYTQDLPSGSGAIRRLSIKVDLKSSPQALRSTILEMTFDGERTVWCPIGDFFCSPDKINPFQTWNRSVQPDGTFICTYVMPYKTSGQIKIINLDNQPVDLMLDVRTGMWFWDERTMYFHANWKPVGTLTGDKFVDMNFVDIKGKGVLMGDALTVLSPGHGWWGEGDEKIYIDETDVARKFPSHFGTGTEDYYGWAGGVNPTGKDTFSIPIGANVCNGNPADPRGYNICTRNRILDAIPFSNRLVFDMEASPGTDIRNPWNLLDYSLVTFWYAFPGSTSNANPEPEIAAKPILTLSQIDRMQEHLKTGTVEMDSTVANFSKKIQARPGQFLVFPITLKATTINLNDVKIHFSPFQPATGNRQPATCFTTGGIDFLGNPFTKIISVPANETQEFWMGMDLSGLEKGLYSISLTLTSGDKSQTVPLEITIAGDPIPNHGYDQGSTLARLNWLNSTVGINDNITRGFIPITVQGNRISILGRTLEIADNGLPAAITSFFGASNQELKKEGEPLINSSFRFVIERSDGTLIRLKPGKLTITRQSDSKVIWSVVNSSPDFDLELTGRMEFDGFVDYSLKLTAKTAAKIRDIRLEIPMNAAKAEYMMGLNHEGGTRAKDWKWKWDVTKNQDMLWIGAVNSGMRIKWKAENYRRPLINIYYAFGPLNLPPSWENAGNGGVNIGLNNGDIVVNAYSGPREMQAGEVLNYDFELLLTPFRTMNKSVQFGDRYFHGGGTNTSVKIATAKTAGANIINIHHAEDLYPFINYPYLDENTAELTQLVAKTHEAGMRMKFYYTTRELTKNLPEFRAFYSLNGEVIFPGPGDAAKTIINPNGPNEWLKKNLKGKYIPAWNNLVNEGKFKGETDLSVITTPDSRLNNFYVAGLDWMVRNMKIDGVYIDDSALDRFTLMRARKIIDRYRPDGRMDLHSWNHFNEWAGFTNCLNLYMDLLPYFDQVWIGEGRDYNRMPDHWLIEVSGIPFGLPGQMLEGGGNPWRGMVYGISNRAGWTANPPGEIWKFWDDYQIQDKEMIGYWDKSCPVICTNPMVRATVYRGKDQSIIAVANWTKTDQPISLLVNWQKLGIDPAKANTLIPEIKDFQAEQKTVTMDKLVVPGGKGLLIVVSSSR